MTKRRAKNRPAKKPSLPTQDWLVGGGEMGERIRVMNWAETQLGADGVVAPEPAKRGEHFAAIKGPDRPFLGAGSDCALQRRIQSCLRHKASLGPRQTGAGMLE